MLEPSAFPKPLLSRAREFSEGGTRIRSSHWLVTGGSLARYGGLVASVQKRLSGGPKGSNLNRSREIEAALWLWRIRSAAASDQGRLLRHRWQKPPPPPGAPPLPPAP